jgi:hypothetical protein
MTLLSSTVCAQEFDPMVLLSKIKEVNNGNAISYDYMICNQHKRSGLQRDMLKGVLYKQDKNYLDSNAKYLSAVMNGYYCKLVYYEQSATIFEVEAFKKKMGIPLDDYAGNVIPISDSLIRRYGKLNAQEGSGVYMIELNMAAPYSTKFVLKAKKDDLRIISIRMEMAAEEGEGSEYIKVYEMQHFKYKIDERIFDYSRFFKLVQGRKIILNGRYAKYHLNTLTN